MYTRIARIRCHCREDLPSVRVDFALLKSVTTSAQRADSDDLGIV